jgi:hypothetical protein
VKRNRAREQLERLKDNVKVQQFLQECDEVRMGQMDILLHIINYNGLVSILLVLTCTPDAELDMKLPLSRITEPYVFPSLHYCIIAD